MLDQVEPTLLIYTVWSAIDLVPSWTKKINPRASDNRPTNRRTKRIMAFYAQRNMHRPAIAYPARAPRSIGSDDLPLGTRRGRRPHRGAGGLDDGFYGFYWLAFRDWHSIRYLWPSRQPPRGYLGGEMSSKSDGRGARPTFTDQEALLFHSQGRPGKLEVVATKPMATQRDLSLAYSPGVALPVLAIAEHEDRAFDYTTKGNFVAVITNATGMLGRGNGGGLAGKPVMEGKAVLFKRFADIDSIDLEVSSEDPDEIVNCVKLLGKSWGGINLEDIRAPECFVIEQRLRE